jgi:hypothetical protein
MGFLSFLVGCHRGDLASPARAEIEIAAHPVPEATGGFCDGKSFGGRTLY